MQYSLQYALHSSIYALTIKVANLWFIEIHIKIKSILLPLLITQSLAFLKSS